MAVLAAHSVAHPPELVNCVELTVRIEFGSGPSLRQPSHPKFISIQHLRPFTVDNWVAHRSAVCNGQNLSGFFACFDDVGSRVTVRTKLIALQPQVRAPTLVLDVAAGASDVLTRVLVENNRGEALRRLRRRSRVAGDALVLHALCYTVAIRTGVLIRLDGNRPR